jgi:hypothetical protein
MAFSFDRINFYSQNKIFIYSFLAPKLFIVYRFGVHKACLGNEVCPVQARVGSRHVGAPGRQIIWRSSKVDYLVPRVG